MHAKRNAKGMQEGCERDAKGMLKGCERDAKGMRNGMRNGMRKGMRKVCERDATGMRKGCEKDAEGMRKGCSSHPFWWSFVVARALIFRLGLSGRMRPQSCVEQFQTHMGAKGVRKGCSKNANKLGFCAGVFFRAVQR